MIGWRVQRCVGTGALGIVLLGQTLGSGEAPAYPTLVFPHAANGVFTAINSRFAIEVKLQNTGIDDTGSIQFFRSDGSPMRVTIDGDTDHTFAYAVPAGGTMRVRTSGAGDPQVGYVSVRSHTPEASELSGSLKYIDTDLATGTLRSIVSVEASPLSTIFTAYQRTDRAAETFTGYAFHNPNPDELTIAIELRDRQGALLYQGEITLGTGQHRARFAHELHPVIPDTDGTLIARAPTPFAMTSLELEAGLLASVPVVDGFYDADALTRIKGQVAPLRGAVRKVTGRIVTFIDPMGGTASAVLNSDGRYTISVYDVAGLADNQLGTLSIAGASDYGYQRPLRVRPTFAITRVLPVQTVRRFSDPDNSDDRDDDGSPATGQPLDGLDHLRYMNWADGGDGCRRTYSQRWRDADVPIKVWLHETPLHENDAETAPPGVADLIREVLPEWERGTGLRLFQEVDEDPTDGITAPRPFDPTTSPSTGLRLDFFTPPSQTEFRALEGIPCEAPTKGVVTIPNNFDLDHPNERELLRVLVLHELGHALGLGINRHSKYPTHAMHAVAGHWPTAFERRTVEVLYRLANETHLEFYARRE